MVLHDTPEDVRDAATDRASDIEGWGSVVPFENVPLPRQGLGCLPVLTNNPELTGSPWSKEPASGSFPHPAQTIKVAAERIQEPHSQSPAPITNAPGTQTSEFDESDWVAKSPERTDSAPFYKPSGYREQTSSDEDSSANAWGQ
jgi:hypothetical protein